MIIMHVKSLFKKKKICVHGETSHRKLFAKFGYKTNKNYKNLGDLISGFLRIFFQQMRSD